MWQEYACFVLLGTNGAHWLWHVLCVTGTRVLSGPNGAHRKWRVLCVIGTCVCFVLSGPNDVTDCDMLCERSTCVLCCLDLMMSLTVTCSVCDRNTCVLWWSMHAVVTWWCHWLWPVLCVTGTRVFCDGVCMRWWPDDAHSQRRVLRATHCVLRWVCSVGPSVPPWEQNCLQVSWLRDRWCVKCFLCGHAQACPRMHAHTHTHMCAHMHTCTHTCMHTHAHSHMCSFLHACTHTCTCLHTSNCWILVAN